MQSEARGEALVDLVLRAPMRERRELTAVLLASGRVELTQALRRLAHKKADGLDFDQLFGIAAEIAAAARLADLPGVRAEALALERTAAAAHVGGARGESDLFAAGLKVVEAILETSPERPASAARSNRARFS